MPEREINRKIAIVGGVCTGKTTLLYEYQQKKSGDSRFAFVEEAARSFYQDHPRSTLVGQPSIEVAKRIQARALENEIKAEQTGAQFILCDSSILTAVMYMHGREETDKAEELLSTVEFWLPTYDQFLLLNPDDVPYQDDDIRKEGIGHRARTHQAYIDFFTERDIPYKLLCGTVAERMRGIDEVLYEPEEDQGRRYQYPQ